MSPRIPVAVVALACLCLATPSAHAATTTLEGVVRTVAVVPATTSPGAHEQEQQVLVAGGRTYALEGEPAEPNTRAVVTGRVRGATFDAAQVRELAPLPGLADTGTTRVLAMLVQWDGPDALTPEQASQQLFGDSAGWYRDASYGALGQTGDVTPWLTVPEPADGCYAGGPQLLEDAKAAAAAAGYDVAGYDNFIVYFPRCLGDAADKGGWAYVGAPGLWVNGSLDRRTTVHEQGHNYGLSHSHSAMCSGGGLRGTCTFSDYGDPYDAMGASAYVAHFNGAQKALLGWMDGRTIDLTEGGSAGLLPMAGPGEGARVATVDTPGGLRYWVEYRRPEAFDAELPGFATDGLLVHASGPGSGSTDDAAVLLDVRPEDGIDVTTATLRAGETWTSPEGVVLTATSVGPIGATVAVDRVGVPARPATATVTDHGNGTVTLAWTPPTGSPPVTGYRVGRDGANAAGAGPWQTRVAASARSQGFGPLVLGRTYTLGVAAVNDAGAGPASSVTVTPGVPEAPTAFTVTRDGGGRATLRWADPAGGAPVTGFRVTRDGVDDAGAGPLSTDVDAATHTLALTGLVPERPYALTVRALGAGGPGAAATATVTLDAERPAAATLVRARPAGAGRVTVSWSAPAGGAAVTGYRVTRTGLDGVGVASTSRTAASTQRWVTFTRLVTGRSYTFTVQAAAAGGTGPAVTVTATA